MKTDDNWEVTETMVRRGASIAASTLILAGVEIREYLMVGIGVRGNPAKIYGQVDRAGRAIKSQHDLP